MADAVIASPGPWRVDPIPDDAHTDPDINVDQDAILWISEDRVGGEVLALVQRIGEHNPGDVVANGRLMAAAPELLASVRAFVEMYDGTRDMLGPAVSAKLRAAECAIAKAERG